MLAFFVVSRDFASSFVCKALVTVRLDSCCAWKCSTFVDMGLVEAYEYCVPSTVLVLCCDMAHCSGTNYAFDGWRAVTGETCMLSAEPAV